MAGQAQLTGPGLLGVLSQGPTSGAGNQGLLGHDACLNQPFLHGWSVPTSRYSISTFAPANWMTMCCSWPALKVATCSKHVQCIGEL